MARPPLARLAAATATGLLLSGLLAVAPSGASAVSVPAERRAPNPTGTNAGSPANGVGNLKVSLVATADGRIRVSWKRPGPARRLKKFVVKVGPSRHLDARVRTYRVSRTRQSVVVDHAADVVPASGNYTFVRVSAHRRKGGSGGSPGKWIQAPVTTPCTAAPEDRLTVATFNLRTWAADKSDDLAKWSVRGPNAVAEVLRSGARAVAVQEASGSTKPQYGGRSQAQWMLDRLNQEDPGARWVDALTPASYKPPKGRKPGLVGTRVFYDASRFDLLDSGLHRIVVPGWSKDSLIPWARLQAIGGDQAPFVLTSNHLRVGPDRAAYRIRVRQTRQTLGHVRDLRSRFGDTVIVAGDLNSTANQLPMNYVQRTLIRAGLYDAFATTDLVGAQYPTTNGSRYPVPKTPLRRDYILSYGPVQGSCSYRNQAYQRPSQEASDHFLQVATLPLPAI
ncbi:endonuclease/exonuclease/phosphatase family protein [Nocardioides dongkuii]|uniref:endonuclease/exonuclease/phosphatase family protein n=1 Tax=Nocardioides dongkuii TaxID=2760089 RepID=UPI0015F89E57|nr:endonuclease/exonuclease/phosphatase family protein [Nocardioides dongkuii]